MRIETRAPRGHVIIAVIAILWSLAGVAAFIGQETMSAETIAALPADQRELWTNQPLWAIVAYSVAVFAQLAGAVALLLRRRIASPLFVAAIVAVLVQFSYPFLIAKALSLTDPAKSAFPLVILLIAVALFFYARWATKAGLLN